MFPGVLQLEALAQAGAIALLSDERYAGSLPLFGGVEDVRFRRMVKPGDEMTLSVEIERLSRRGGWGRGVATVDGEECCRARLLFVIALKRRAAQRRRRDRCSVLSRRSSARSLGLYGAGWSAVGGGIVGWSGSSPSRTFVATSRGSGGSARTRRDGAISDHQERDDRSADDQPHEELQHAFGL